MFAQMTFCRTPIPRLFEFCCPWRYTTRTATFPCRSLACLPEERSHSLDVPYNHYALYPISARSTIRKNLHSVPPPVKTSVNSPTLCANVISLMVSACLFPRFFLLILPHTRNFQACLRLRGGVFPDLPGIKYCGTPSLYCVPLLLPLIFIYQVFI